MNDWNPRANEVFARAILCESDEDRDAYIADACGEDDDLRAAVSILLQAHFEAGNFLRDDAFSPSLSPSEGPSVPAITTAKFSNSVVASLRKANPELKQVALRDSPSEGRVTKPTSKELPESGVDCRYEIHGEIARAVWGSSSRVETQT